MKKLDTFFSSIFFLIIIGIITIFILVHFDVIDNPIYLFKGNDTKLTLSTNSLEMRKGEVTHLEVNNDTGEILEYISNNTNIVTVNEVTGYINAVGAGTATITVRLKKNNNIKDECVVTVIEPVNTIEVKGISLSDTKLSLQEGSSKTLHYSITPSNASAKKIIWSTSDVNIATIDKYGTVKAIGVGQAIIKVRTENGKYATCTVTVTKKKTNNNSNNNNNPTPSIKTYTLTYNANGGSVAPNSKTLNEGSAYGALPTPTRTGYSFTGWYTSASGGNQVTTSTTIKGNTTIYAHWKENSTPAPVPTPSNPTNDTYTIEYRGNGATGGSVSSHTCKMNSSCTIKSNGFTRSGYTFSGWTTKSDGTNDNYNWTGWSGTWTYQNGEWGISNNKVILYAMWTKNQSGSSPIVPSSSNIKYEGSTLKYYVVNKGSYYLTYIWMQDPYKQIKKLDSTTAKYGKIMTDAELSAAGYSPLRRTLGEMFNDYIKNGMIPASKAAIAFNASAFFDDRAWKPPTSYYNLRSDAWLVFNEGKEIRKNFDDVDKWTNNHRVLIGITSSGNLKIYGAGSTLAERQSIYNSVVSDKVRNTFTFRGPVLIGSAASDSWAYTDAAKREVICQIDSNNYAMLTTVNGYKTNDLKPILNSIGCKTAFNLDGGGSTSISFKKAGTNTSTKILCSDGSTHDQCRGIVEGIYFVEL